MKNLNCIIASSLFLVILNQGFAQKKEKTAEWPWEISKIVNTSDSTGAGIFHAKKKAGVVFVNEKGEVEKEVAIAGNVLEIGKWKEGIIAIYSTEWEGTIDKELHAVLIDGRTKAILLDKAIYQNPGNFYMETRAANDEDGNFRHLLVRTSAAEGTGASDKYRRKQRGTTALTAIFLSDKLEPSRQPLSSAAINGAFFSNYTDKKGEIFIISQAGGQVTGEKFGQNGQLLKKISSPLDLDPGPLWEYPMVGKPDPRQDDLLAFSIVTPGKKAQVETSLFIFDFKNEKVISNGSHLLNKDYFMQLKADPGMTDPQHFRDIIGLQPDGIIYMGDRLLVCNEINTLDQEPSLHAVYRALGAIISVYDRQLHLQRQLFLSKAYYSFIDIGRGFSYHIRDGKLLAFDNEGKNTSAYANYYYTIDPDKFTVEKKELEWGNLKKSYPVHINTVFWFRNSIVKTHFAADGFMGHPMESRIQKINY